MTYAVIEQEDTPTLHKYRAGVKDVQERVEKKYQSDLCISYVGEHPWGNFGDAYSLSGFNSIGNNYPGLVNCAYRRFKGQLGADSALGSAVVAEGKETLEMLLYRTHALAEGLLALKKGKLPKFGSAAHQRHRIKGGVDLGYTKKAWLEFPYRLNLPSFSIPNKGVGRAVKTASGYVLEGGFGWLPIISDVQSTAEAFALQRSLGRRVVGYCENLVSDGMKFPPSKYSWSYVRRLRLSICSRSHITVDNPNLWLASRLGLLNPLAWGWEAIPYSFFADYFANIGNIIDSLDDYVGLVSSQYSRTEFCEGWNKLYYRNGESSFDPNSLKHHFYLRLIRRDVSGPPEPVFETVKAFPWGSARRVATTLSLIAQKLIH
jgi:hypothetical protein